MKAYLTHGIAMLVGLTLGFALMWDDWSRVYEQNFVLRNLAIIQDDLIGAQKDLARFKDAYINELEGILKRDFNRSEQDEINRRREQMEQELRKLQQSQEDDGVIARNDP